MRAFGECTVVHMPSNADGGYDFCLECIGKMSVRCAWCEEPIFVGDPITLYRPTNPYHWFPKEAAVYSLDRIQMVGCGRTTCAESGADYCGYWVPTGTQHEGAWIAGVQRFPSALERVMQSGQAVVINNLSDPRQTRPVSEVTIPEYVPPLAA